MNHQINVPKKPGHYFITNEHKTILEYVDNVRESNQNINILVKGPQGSGKSTMPLAYAASRRLPLATLEIGLLSEASQIFGSMRLENGQTIYKEGLLTKAISTPGCVVHLQELNRPESDKTLNAIFSILDEQQRKIWIDDAQQFVEVAPGVTFFATLNEGYEFIGTMPVDIALEDRFALKMHLDYLPQEHEINLLILRCLITGVQAGEIVGLARQLRSNVQDTIRVSTRSLIAIGDMVKFGMPIMTAMRSTIAIEKDKLESVLSVLHFGDDNLGRRILPILYFRR